MEEQQTHKIWKVIELEVQQALAILNIDEKLAQHISGIKSVSIHCIPYSLMQADVPECGELSVSINNRKDLILHTTTSYTSDLPRDLESTLNLNAKLDENSRITGYYRDYGTMKNSGGELIPYRVKIIIECTKKSNHEQ